MNAARLFDEMGGGFGRGSNCGAPLIVDSFAGGGGASTGIEMALGRSPDIAINHDADALAMHQVNHPETLHLSKNIWHVDPLEAVGNRRVGLAWFSPDCKHFSKAKGGRPVKRNIRDLAWVVVLWARRVRPEVIILENVEEFQEWGPLVEREPGKWVPCPDRRGQTFRKWCADLKRLGYKLEFKKLRACDYGAPTIRKRFLMIARRDGRPIVWPEPTHGSPDDEDVIAGRKKPWRMAYEIIDWSLPCPSIFDTSAEIMEKFGVRAIRPLAEATMRRIARGVVRYVLEAKKPFVVADGCVVAAHLAKFQTGSTGTALDEPAPTITANGYVKRPGGAAPIGVVATTMVQTGYGERAGQAPRALDMEKPIGTQVGGGAKHGVVAAFLAQHNNDIRRIGGVNPGRPADEPLATLTAAGAQQNLVAAHLMNMKGSDRRSRPADAPAATVTSGGQHAALISGFLMKYYGTGGQWARLDDPAHTDTSRDRMGLVTVEIDGTTYAIADIGMRMLTPRERFRAQGFPDDHVIDRRPDGSAITGTVQGRCCGNSVCPPLAEALVRANCGHLAVRGTGAPAAEKERCA